MQYVYIQNLATWHGRRPLLILIKSSVGLRSTPETDASWTIIVLSIIYLYQLLFRALIKAQDLKTDLKAFELILNNLSHTSAGHSFMDIWRHIMKRSKGILQPFCSETYAFVRRFRNTNICILTVGSKNII